MEEKKNRIASAAKWGLGVMSAVVIFAAQTKHEDAISNIGGWLNWLGVDRVPDALATASADTWVTVLGVLSLLVTAWWMLRPSQRRKVIQKVRNIFHRELQTETKPVASLGIEVTRAAPKRGKYEITDEALAGLQRVLDGVKAAEENAPRRQGWFLDFLMRSKSNADDTEAARLEREEIEKVRQSFAGTLPKPRGAMEYGDYWKEAGAEWVELLFLRDEASLGRPVTYWQTTPGHNEAFDLLNDLRQAAVDGAVAFRGRRYDYDRPEMLAKTIPLTDIPKEHFHEHEFMLGGFIESDTNYMTFVGKHEFVPVAVRKTHRDIRANREQLTEWWRRHQKEQRDE